jgi:hypothetical protein
MKMTPGLQAALIRLRDANVAYRAASDAVTNHYTRSKEGKAQQQRCFDAVDVRRDALDDLLAIIDPDSVEDDDDAVVT